jgi:hypothetical protein
MTWFRLEDSFANHPKVLKAGNAAVGLWVRCGTYSSQYLLDGHVPLEIAKGLGRPGEIDTLLETRMWIQNGDGFLIPDFLEYQPSREEVEAERARRGMTRAEAGHLGGIASGIARRSNGASKP